MDEIYKNAKTLMQGFCRVCPVCNGRACAGEVPGMGGLGTASSFTANVQGLADHRFNMRLIHEVKDPDTRVTLLGKSLALPVLAAPIGGVSFNMGGGITEQEYVEAVIRGCVSRETLGCTGDGVPDNPHFDLAEPRAPRSRVWVRGLRNPFRIHVVPPRGSPGPGPRPEAARLPGRGSPGPGVILIGDVGQSLFEELDVALAGGENFGWPVHEGMDLQPGRSEIFRDNLDAPNPLFGVDVAGFGLCMRWTICPTT